MEEDRKISLDRRSPRGLAGLPPPIGRSAADHSARDAGRGCSALAPVPCLPRGPSGYCDKRPAPPPLRPEFAVAFSLGNGSIPDCPLQPFGCKWPRSASLVVSRCPRKMPRPYGWELGPKHPKWFEPCPDPPPFTQGLGWRFNLRFGPGPDQCHLKGTAGVSWKRRVRHVCRACDPIVSGMRTHSSRNRKRFGWVGGV